MQSDPGENLATCCQEVCGERVLTGALSIYGLVCHVLLILLIIDSIVQNSIDISTSLTATGGARA